MGECSRVREAGAERERAPASRRKRRERQGAHCDLGQNTPENAVGLGMIAINPYVPALPGRTRPGQWSVVFTER